MKTTILFAYCTVVLVCFFSYLSADVCAQKTKINNKERIVTQHAKGTFEVKVTPLAAEENIGDPTIGRLSLEKTFIGDIAGTSKGQMLGSQGETEKDTGGYVAMERITGTLNGKKGGFSLQHHGTMGGGKFEMNVYVVPGTGTGELAGIAGTMKIKIEGGKHFYELDYTLPPGK
jgi:hypothetical protein